MANVKSHIDENGRECLRCKEYKLFEFFYKIAKSKIGYDGTCIECRRELGKANSKIDINDDPTALDKELANSFLYARAKPSARGS